MTKPQDCDTAGGPSQVVDYYVQPSNRFGLDSFADLAAVREGEGASGQLSTCAFGSGGKKQDHDRKTRLEVYGASTELLLHRAGFIRNFDERRF